MAGPAYARKVRSRRSQQQPQGAAQIDWSVPLARNLIFAWYPDCGTDLAGGAVPTLRTGSSITAGFFGRAVSSTVSAFTNRGVVFTGAAAVDITSTPVTLVVFLNYWHAGATALNSNVMAAGALALEIDPTTALPSLYRNGARTVGANPISYGVPVCIAATFRSGLPGALYVNGNLDTGYTDDVRTGTATVNALLGLDSTSSAEGAVSLALAFSRQLSAAEIQELYNNPWRLFQSAPTLYLPTPAEPTSTSAVARFRTRPTNVQPQGTPRVDWSNPITKGLVFCAVPVGTTFLDCVTGVFGTPSGALTRQVRSRNSGKSNDVGSVTVAASGVTTDQVLWPVSNDRGATLVQTGTLLCLGGTTAQVDGTMYPFGGNAEAVSFGDGFSLVVDSFGNLNRGGLIKSAYLATAIRGYSITELLGNPFDNRTHFFGYSFNANGVNGNWLSSGVATPYAGGNAIAHGTTTTNRRATVLGTSADTGIGTGSRNAYVALFLMWDREITPAEYASLYDNPWQLFVGRRAPDFTTAVSATSNTKLRPASDISTGTWLPYVATYARKPSQRRARQPQSPVAFGPNYAGPDAWAILGNGTVVRNRFQQTADRVGAGTPPFFVAGPAGVGLSGDINTYHVAPKFPFALVGTTWVMCFTAISTTTGVAWGEVDNATSYLEDLLIAADAGGTPSTGILTLNVRDTATTLLSASTANIGINDGKPHTVVWTLASTTTMLCYVDGAAQALTYNASGTLVPTVGTMEFNPWICTRNLRGVVQIGSSAMCLHLIARLMKQPANLPALSVNPWQLFASAPPLLLSANVPQYTPAKKPQTVRRTQQPQGAVRLDRANPLVQGLVQATTGGSPEQPGFGVVSGATWTPQGSVPKAGLSGVGVHTDGAATYAYRTGSALGNIASGTAFTVAAVAIADDSNVSAAGQTVLTLASPADSLVWLHVNRVAGGDANLFVRDIAFNSSFLSPTNTITAGKPFVLVGVNYGAASRKVVLDGNLSAAATATDNIASQITVDNTSIGALIRSSTDHFFNGTTYLTAVWNRALSDAEITSFSANPWQLFQPSRTPLLSVNAGLYTALDETPADDTDFDSTSSASTMEVLLQTGTAPGVSTGHIVRYRLKGTGGARITVTLRQGVTAIARWSQVPPDGFTTYEQVLSAVQASMITDYTNLRLRFTSA